MTNIKILGNGGHFLSVVDCIDNDYHDTESIVGNIEEIQKQINFSSDNLHIAIGNISTRKKIIKTLNSFSPSYHTIIDKNAIISKTATIHDGCFIGKASVVNAYAIIYENCIINTGAIIEHECEVGENSHIAPNATLLGNVKIGKNCFVGSSAVIFPGVKITDDVVIGANSIIRKDILKSGTYYAVYNG